MRVIDILVCHQLGTRHLSRFVYAFDSHSLFGPRLYSHKALREQHMFWAGQEAAMGWCMI